MPIGGISPLAARGNSKCFRKMASAPKNRGAQEALQGVPAAWLDIWVPPEIGAGIALRGGTYYYHGLLAMRLNAASSPDIPKSLLNSAR
jgi:hypothetical protein